MKIQKIKKLYEEEYSSALAKSKEKIDKWLGWEIVSFFSKGQTSFYLHDIFEYSHIKNKNFRERIINEIISHYSKEGLIVKQKGVFNHRLVFIINKNKKEAIKNRFEIMDIEK